VGVSNFGAHRVTDVPVAVNQIEFHPRFRWPGRVSYCRGTDVVVETAAPLARPVVFEDEVVRELAETYDGPPAQVVPRWAVEADVAVIPGSASSAHVRESVALLDWEPTATDRRRPDGRDRDRPVYDTPARNWSGGVYGISPWSTTGLRRRVGESAARSGEVPDEPPGEPRPHRFREGGDEPLGDDDHRFPEERVDAGDGDRGEDAGRDRAVEGGDRREGEGDPQREVLGRAVVADEAPRREPPVVVVAVDRALGGGLPGPEFEAAAEDVGGGVEGRGREEQRRRDDERVGADQREQRRRRRQRRVVDREVEGAAVPGVEVEVREQPAQRRGDDGERAEFGREEAHDRGEGDSRQGVRGGHHRARVRASRQKR
jgi:hypothetical protein